MTRVAIMTDEVGWHTRQLQAALRERGVVGRCVDLADCRIDTSAVWHGGKLAVNEVNVPLPWQVKATVENPPETDTKKP